MVAKTKTVVFFPYHVHKTCNYNFIIKKIQSIKLCDYFFMKFNFAEDQILTAISIQIWSQVMCNKYRCSIVVDTQLISRTQNKGDQLH